MQIEKYYEENIIVGDFVSSKIGLKIKTDKEIKSAEELAAVSGKLLLLAKTTVQKELAQIKAEKQGGN